jgi:hypothetical protein
VYTPKIPNLYTLNATAWMILELCEGRTLRDIERKFHRGVEPLMSQEEAAAYVLACLRDFVGKSIVETVPVHHRLVTKAKGGKKRHEESEKFRRRSTACSSTKHSGRPIGHRSPDRSPLE